MAITPLNRLQKFGNCLPLVAARSVVRLELKRHLAIYTGNEFALVKAIPATIWRRTNRISEIGKIAQGSNTSEYGC